MADQEETTAAGIEPENGPGNSSSLAADILFLFLWPRKLFDYLPRCNRVTGALTFLFLVESLCGWATYSTRVLQLEIDEKTQHAVAVFQKEHEGDEEFEAVVAGVDSLYKGAEFSKQLLRVWLILGKPTLTMILVGLLAGTWFVLVALTVGKPNFQLLAGVIAFAWLVEIPEAIIRVGLIRALEASRVESSAAAFASGPGVGLAGYILFAAFKSLRLLVLVAGWTGHLARRPDARPAGFALDFGIGLLIWPVGGQL